MGSLRQKVADNGNYTSNGRLRTRDLRIWGRSTGDRPRKSHLCLVSQPCNNYRDKAAPTQQQKSIYSCHKIIQISDLFRVIPHFPEPYGRVCWSDMRPSSEHAACRGAINFPKWTRRRFGRVHRLNVPKSLQNPAEGKASKWKPAGDSGLAVDFQAISPEKLALGLKGNQPFPTNSFSLFGVSYNNSTLSGFHLQSASIRALSYPTNPQNLFLFLQAFSQFTHKATSLATLPTSPILVTAPSVDPCNKLHHESSTLRQNLTNKNAT